MEGALKNTALLGATVFKCQHRVYVDCVPDAGRLELRNYLLCQSQGMIDCVRGLRYPSVGTIGHDTKSCAKSLIASECKDLVTA